MSANQVEKEAMLAEWARDANCNRDHRQVAGGHRRTSVKNTKYEEEKTWKKTNHVSKTSTINCRPPLILYTQCVCEVNTA